MMKLECWMRTIGGGYSYRILNRGITSVVLHVAANR